MNEFMIIKWDVINLSDLISAGVALLGIFFAILQYIDYLSEKKDNIRKENITIVLDQIKIIVDKVNSINIGQYVDFAEGKLQGSKEEKLNDTLNYLLSIKSLMECYSIEKEKVILKNIVILMEQKTYDMLFEFSSIDFYPQENCKSSENDILNGLKMNYNLVRGFLNMSKHPTQDLINSTIQELKVEIIDLKKLKWVF